MTDTQPAIVAAVHDYWNDHTLGLQYVTDPQLVLGSRAFFDHIRPWMNPFKFPWIMARIEREASLLRGQHLLEIGCGMGYDSLEFIKRGVRVTATDLALMGVTLANIGSNPRTGSEVFGIDAVRDTLSVMFTCGMYDATGTWSCQVGLPAKKRARRHPPLVRTGNGRFDTDPQSRQ